MPPPGPVWTIVVAAGAGRRFGGLKQYQPLAGRPVVDWSLTAARAASDGVVLVLPPGDVDATDHADVVVAGGLTRSASVRNGLAAVPAEAEVIVVHDAARPLAGADLFRAVIVAVRDGADGAICAVPVTDTIRRIDGGVIDRDQLIAVQTPQAFRADALRAAHAGAQDATDDAALVEANGRRVVTVPGSTTNIKITHPSDVAVAAAMLEYRP